MALTPSRGLKLFWLALLCVLAFAVYHRRPLPEFGGAAESPLPWNETEEGLLTGRIVARLELVPEAEGRAETDPGPEGPSGEATGEPSSGTAGAVAEGVSPVPPEVAPPPPAPPPPARNLGRYRVGAGENLRDIAARLLGDANRIDRLLEVNPDIEDPDLIREGQVLLVPVATPMTRPGAIRQDPPAAFPRSHTVAAGDNLSKISRQHYGTDRHWRRIYEANRDRLVDPSVVPEGIVLVIPSL